MHEYMKKDFDRAIKRTAKILDAWLPHKILYGKIPGLSVGIVYNGTLVYQGGFGYADVEKKIPATPETCYRVASISKTFTAVAIMQLVEQRKIALDDKVEVYLPWFKAKNKNLDSRAITIRQLLSHTAGVFRDGDTPHWVTDTFPDDMALKKSISDKTLVFENLTQFKYSNFGFALLGQIIGKVSGQNYEEYISENILRKLGMKRTASDLTEENKEWLAKGYSFPSPHREREAFRHIQVNAYAPAAGFLSNVQDLTHYLSALSLKRKTSHALLEKELKKEMMKKYWDTGETGYSYGLGLGIYEIEHRKIVGHAGGFVGFTTQISLDIENDIGIITLSNTDSNSLNLLNDGILETIYRFADGIHEYGDGKKIQNQENYEGVYSSRWGEKIVVGGDTILVVFDPRTNSPVKHSDALRSNKKNSFVINAQSNFDDQGECAVFVFEKNTQQAKRMFWGPMPMERL